MTESNAPDLLPCPFCGNVGFMSRITCEDGGGIFYTIKCGECGAQSREKYCSKGNDCPQFYAEVRDEWNTRPQPDTNPPSEMEKANARLALIDTPPPAPTPTVAEDKITVSIQTMRLTDNREEYYVRIACGDRTIETRRYTQGYRNRAEYEVDELRHVLLNAPKPDLIDPKYDDDPEALRALSEQGATSATNEQNSSCPNTWDTSAHSTGKP